MALWLHLDVFESVAAGHDFKEEKLHFTYSMPDAPRTRPLATDIIRDICKGFALGSHPCDALHKQYAFIATKFR